MSSTDLDSSHSNDPQKPLDLEYGEIAVRRHLFLHGSYLF